MATASNGCGKKHLTLACWIIGLVLGLTFVMSLALAQPAKETATEAKEQAAKVREDLEPRVRDTEKIQAANAAALQNMQDSIKRIESGVLRLEDKLNRRTP